MARIMMDGGGLVKGGADADYSDVSLKSIGQVSTDRLLGAIASVMRDEINTLRLLPLLSLTARSVDDLVNAIKAKL